jgi:hypothetical protein
MSAPDFSHLTPDVGMTDQWIRGSYGHERSLCITAARWGAQYAAEARWGAQYAAEQLAGQWPEPITDRPPTEADADAGGIVQYLSSSGRWGILTWKAVADQDTPWQHCPNWRPKPLTEAQHIAAMLRRDGPLTTELRTRAAELLEDIQ